MFNLDHYMTKKLIKIIIIFAMALVLLPFANVTWVSDMNAYNEASEILGNEMFAGLDWEFSDEAVKELDKLMNAGILEEDTYKKILGMEITETVTDPDTYESVEVPIKYDPVVDNETFSGFEGIVGAEFIGYRLKMIKKLPNYFIIVSLITAACGLFVLDNDNLKTQSLHIVSAACTFTSLMLLVLAFIFFIPYYKLGDYGANLCFQPHIGWYLSVLVYAAVTALSVISAVKFKER